MKNDKKVFFLIEAVLGIMVVVLAFLMLQEKNGKDLAKVSIILQNSEDNQWAGFKYGLKMAAEDHGIEMSVVTTEGAWNAADEMDLIEAEIEHGADAVIVQPAPGAETEKALKKIQKKVPVMLVGSAASEERDDSELPVTEPDHYAMGAALAQ